MTVLTHDSARGNRYALRWIHILAPSIARLATREGRPMSRILRHALFAALIGCAGIAQAGWPSSGGYNLWYDIKGGWHTNNRWPDPHLMPDRQTVYNHYAISPTAVGSGNALLGEHHFEAEGKLSTAGQMRVRTILTQSPPERRTVFVEQGLTPEATRARIDTVQQYITGMVANGPLPEVVASNLQSEGCQRNMLIVLIRSGQGVSPRHGCQPR